MLHRFSAYSIENIEEIPFRPEDYSRFKFGEGRLAKAFGEELAEKFIKKYSDLLLSEQEIVLVPSPYNAIPTASCAMSDYFKAAINHFLFHNGQSSLLTSKIHRYKTYSIDYGNLSYQERMDLISSDTYHLDKSFLQGRVVLFLDDIKITGSHEQIIRRQLAQTGTEGEFYFVYFAELTNSDIAPNFENYLNYAAIKHLSDVIPLINSATFIFNTRIIKYILISSPTDVDLLIKNISLSSLQTLVQYAISNNYHLMEEYKHNLQTIYHHINHGN